MRLLSVILMATTATAALLAGAAEGGGADPVKEKLEKAKEAHQAARAKNREYVIEVLTKLEEKARKAGNATVVDKIKAAAQEYEKSGALPTGLPATAKQRLLTARTAMDKAFATAVKEYTKQKKDDLADQVEKEWDAFKLDVADDPGVMRLLNKTSDKYATVPKSGPEPKLLIYDEASGMPQRFRVVSAAAGGWLYLQTLDGKGLIGTDKGGVRNGTEVVISAPRSGTAAASQQWGMQATADGWGRLVNRASGKVLSVLDRSRSNGGRLVIWSNEKAEPSQDWKFD
jgi:hypothetical protein